MQILQGDQKIMRLELLILIVTCGLWNIGDGIGSIIIYRKQTLKEQVPRVVRVIVGGLILSLYFLIG